MRRRRCLPDKAIKSQTAGTPHAIKQAKIFLIDMGRVELLAMIGTWSAPAISPSYILQVPMHWAIPTNNTARRAISLLFYV